MNHIHRWYTALPIALLTAVSAACADSDNPLALAQLQPQIALEVHSERVETFEEVEIHVGVSEGGSRLAMHDLEVEIEPVSGGPARVVTMEPDGDEFAAHLTFFEPGEHHLHFRGIPQRHQLLLELGEAEIHAERHHAVVGPYWIEVETTPAPISPNSTAHVHLLVFEDAGGGPGAPVEGLLLEASIHDPQGVEAAVTVTEEEGGEYETEYTFVVSGVYELHVEVEVAGQHEEIEFHLQVPGAEDSADEEPAPGGGHGH